MPMYNLIEYSDNYSKTSGSIWQYYKVVPNNNLENSGSFKFKVEITGKTPDDGNTKDVETVVPLKYLSNFWRTLKMPLINCEVNLIFARSKDCVITNSTGGFRKTISWNKYKSSVKTFARNKYLNYLINPSFQGVNQLFVLSFENENDRSSHSAYYLPKVEIKYYNVMIE